MSFEINPLVTNIKDKSKYDVDSSNINSLNNNLYKYSLSIIDSITDPVAFESTRQTITISIFAFYALISIIAFIAFFKRKGNLLLALSLILLITLPLLICFQGVSAAFFFPIVIPVHPSTKLCMRMLSQSQIEV